MRSEALIRAQRKYDQKRPKPVSVRLSQNDLVMIHAACRPDESLGQCLRRLALSAVF
jgi:hypothetical protein